VIIEPVSNTLFIGDLNIPRYVAYVKENWVRRVFWAWFYLPYSSPSKNIVPPKTNNDYKRIKNKFQIHQKKRIISFFDLHLRFTDYFFGQSKFNEL
jgi:hypothetical protein